MVKLANKPTRSKPLRHGRKAKPRFSFVREFRRLRQQIDEECSSCAQQLGIKLGDDLNARVSRMRDELEKQHKIDRSETSKALDHRPPKTTTTAFAKAVCLDAIFELYNWHFLNYFVDQWDWREIDMHLTGVRAWLPVATGLTYQRA